jgi:hypothetical protein
MLFIDNLPPFVANMTPEYFEARDRDIRELLRSARLPLLVLRRMGCHRFVCPGERKNFIFSKIVAASLMVLSMKKSLPGSASMNPVRRQFYVQTAKWQQIEWHTYVLRSLEVSARNCEIAEEGNCSLTLFLG